MAKIIKYLLVVNDTTDQMILTDVSLECPNEAVFDANLTIAREESYNGEYTVEGEFDAEPAAEATTDDVLNALLGV